MSVVVTEKAQRPAGRQGECFYCRSRLGQVHADSCPMVVRKVRVRMTVEYEVEVSAHWDARMVEFHRNDGSWCASNALQELEAIFNRDDGPCMCGTAHFEYLGEVSDPPILQES